jgi:hypothetical protein
MIQWFASKSWNGVLVSFASRRLTNPYLALTANHGLEQEKDDPMIKGDKILPDLCNTPG